MLVRLARRFVREFSIDLSGFTVLTEAATGPFATTAPMAALAGAKVYAVARKNRFASERQTRTETLRVARKLRVADRIHFVARPSAAPLSTIDILTNSGNVRPIRHSLLKKLPRNAVVSLMVEPWEVRKSDIALPALREFQIPAAGPNEGGKKVAVFDFLDPLLRMVIRKNRLSIRGKRVFLSAAPRFQSVLHRAIRGSGGRITTQPDQSALVVLASGPDRIVSARLLRRIPDNTPVIQLWGQVSGSRSKRLRWYPVTPPPAGHMGFLLSDLGPEPAIRLAAAGLKVGELLARARLCGASRTEAIRNAVKSGVALAARY